MKLVYGSVAMRHWFGSRDSREPQDLDIITKEDKRSTKEIQYYWTKAFEYLKNNKDPRYVDPDFLYTIKVSHAQWDIKWTKTMKDIIFLQSKGCVLDKKFYDLLIKDWEFLHGKKKVKMNVPNQGFFKENIKRKYDHDWLHEQFMFNERPLNEKIREDLDSPLCSEVLWNKLTHEDKIKTAKEELYVLTYERLLEGKEFPHKMAIPRMLQKMITSTTSGWFCLFLIENFDELRRLRYYDNKHFENAVKKIKSKKR